jgi:hypothetical protein
MFHKYQSNNWCQTPFSLLIKVLIATWVLTVPVMFLMPVLAGPNDGVTGLNEEQRVYAARTLKFIEEKVTVNAIR